jgi:hypothetical protein
MGLQKAHNRAASGGAGAAAAAHFPARFASPAVRYTRTPQSACYLGRGLV